MFSPHLCHCRLCSNHTFAQLLESTPVPPLLTELGDHLGPRVKAPVRRSPHPPPDCAGTSDIPVTIKSVIHWMVRLNHSISRCGFLKPPPRRMKRTGSLQPHTNTRCRITQHSTSHCPINHPLRGQVSSIRNHTHHHNHRWTSADKLQLKSRYIFLSRCEEQL